MAEFENFERTSEASPSFLGRWNYPDRSLRAYWHRAGADSAYGDAATAERHLIEVHDELVSKDHIRGYSMAAVWGVAESRRIDFLVYDDVDLSDNPGSWVSANPDIGIIITDGFNFPKDLKICGDVSIVLGEEEWYRRHTENFNDFMNNPPGLFHKGLRSV